MPFVGTVMLEHHCANKRKNKKNTRLQKGNVKTKKIARKGTLQAAVTY